MSKFEVQDTSDTPFRDIVGTYDSAFGSIPEYKANIQLDWSMNNYRVTWDANYNSKIEAAEDDVMSATTIHNMQAGYFIESIGTDVHFGIQNVFDTNPPYLNQGVTSTDDNLYSFRGRFFYMGVKKEF